jgi:GR25 family glycosyltransferase involved in LPS biosynthesis
MLLSQFDRIQCLCLDSRRNDWIKIDHQFSRYGGKVERFIVGKGKILAENFYDQIDPPMPVNWLGWNGFPYNAYCCYLAHRKILEKAKNDNIKNILLLEDDVFLEDNFKDVLDQAIIQMTELDIKWDMFWYGTNLEWASANQISNNLVKLNHTAYCWHAVAIKNHMFDILLNLPAEGAFDFLTAKYIQPNYQCYAAWPNIAIQKAGISFVNGKFEDYSNFFKSIGNNKIK